MMRLRLTRPPLQAYRYQRRVQVRFVHGYPWVSNAPAPVSVRELRNIRRKEKKLLLSPKRLGQKRSFQGRVIYGFPWVSDARPSQARLSLRNITGYVRRRPR